MRPCELLVQVVVDYAIYLVDADGLICSWNAGAERLYGYSAQEIMGQPLARLYAPEDAADGAAEQRLAEVAAIGRGVEEGWRVRKDGSRFRASAVTTVIRDSAGKLRWYARVTRDITEQERASARLQQSLAAVEAELFSHDDKLERRIAEQVRAITEAQTATIFALARLAEARDEVGQHLERVQTFSRTLAQQMREMGFHGELLTGGFIETLSQTAPLHDIGKVGVPDAVLLKPGKLTPEEFEQMKRHSVLGGETLEAVLARYPGNQFLRMGVEVARSHHEKWDGSGYPAGLAGPAVPLSARIVALADFYDALTSARCYRPAVSHEETTRMIEEQSGRHFDPDVVAAFLVVKVRFRRIRQEMGEARAAAR